MKIDKGLLKNLKYFFLASLFVLLSSNAMADGVFDTLIDQYHTNTTTWYTTFYNLGKSLFWGFALIEFSWSTIIWALEGKDVGEIVSNLVKKAISIGFFWYLFDNASTFVPAIIDTFKLAGQKASGIGDISPSKVYDLGVYNGTSIMHSATISVTDLATTLFAKFVSFFIGIFVIGCYIIIAGQLTITIIEGFIAQYMGILFLGFAGSRWTSDYAQKYLAYCVATGVKLMMCYLIIGLGTASVGDVATQLATITDAENAFDVYCTIFANSAVLCFLSWHIPNLASSMLNGSPSMTLGSALATAGTMTASAIGAGAMVAKTAGATGMGVAGVASAVNAGVGLANTTNPGGSVMGNSLAGIGNALKETGSHLNEGFRGAVTNNSTGGKVADRLNARTQTARETQEAGGAYTPPPANNSATAPQASKQAEKPANTANSASNAGAGGTASSATAGATAGATTEASSSGVTSQPQEAEVTSSGSNNVQPPASATTADVAQANQASPVEPTKTEAVKQEAPTRGGNVQTGPNTTAPTAPPAQATQQGPDHYRNVMDKLDQLQKITPPNLPNDASSGGSIDIKINH